jgi:hypothetical protein
LRSYSTSFAVIAARRHQLRVVVVFHRICGELDRVAGFQRWAGIHGGGVRLRQRRRGESRERGGEQKGGKATGQESAPRTGR